MSPKLVPIFGAAAILGAGSWVGTIPELNVRPSDQKSSLDAHESHASSSLLGQFRTSISSWLWLRTDLYLHNGVQMRPMTEAEKLAGVRMQKAGQSENHLQEESAILTVVPAAERDFRGVLGDIEREVTAYKDMHEHGHNDARVALPLFRLMTWSDPQFVPGWVIGASVIAHEKSKQAYPMAFAYLTDGLENNPKSIAILTEIARLKLQEKKDFRGAIPYLESARMHWNASKRGNDDDLEAMLEGYRWLCLSYRETGEIERMRERALEGLQIYPDDMPLTRMSAKPPLMLKPEFWRDWYAGKI